MFAAYEIGNHEVAKFLLEAGAYDLNPYTKTLLDEKDRMLIELVDYCPGSKKLSFYQSCIKTLEVAEKMESRAAHPNLQSVFDQV